MKYDLAEVLRNPLRFVAEKYRHALANPRAVPAKTLGYAKYDFVRVLNKGLDTLGCAGRSSRRCWRGRWRCRPRASSACAARSACWSRNATDGTHGLIEGTYQSPILVQWQHAPRQTRILDVTLTELR